MYYPPVKQALNLFLYLQKGWGRAKPPPPQALPSALSLKGNNTVVAS